MIDRWVDWLVKQDRNSVLAIAIVLSGFVLLFAGSFVYNTVKPKHHCGYDCERIVDQYGPLLEATPNVDATVTQLIRDSQQGQ